MGKELLFFLRNGKILLAARRGKTFEKTILFYEEEKKWRICFDTLFKIEGEIAFEWGSSWREASLEEAQSIFGDTLPDETLWDPEISVKL